MLQLSASYSGIVRSDSSYWVQIGLGVRLAISVGAHRYRKPQEDTKVEGELWKRVFWYCTPYSPQDLGSHLLLNQGSSFFGCCEKRNWRPTMHVNSTRVRIHFVSFCKSDWSLFKSYDLEYPVELDGDVPLSVVGFTSTLQLLEIETEVLRTIVGASFYWFTADSLRQGYTVLYSEAPKALCAHRRSEWALRCPDHSPARFGLECVVLQMCSLWV